ncbi:MAG: helix-turn-helix transcriptional regulator [Chitinophagales bacterium]
MTTLNNELKLSNRETEVLKLAAAGLTTNQIAEKLYLSPNTIESHRRSMIKKAGVKNMSAVIFCAMSAGIIQP